MELENIFMALVTGAASAWLLFVGFTVSKPSDKGAYLFGGVVFGTLSILYITGII
ncbi:MAG: hypothetical protein V3S69_04860 [Dehalococcoidales bacterium]